MLSPVHWLIAGKLSGLDPLRIYPQGSRFTKIVPLITGKLVIP
jgi:hypothetical protein